MNYKCPFAGGLCDPACRFYSIEPQFSSVDKDGPGSCTLAQFCRVATRTLALFESNELKRKFQKGL
jgi:hypothetical protein